MNELSHNFLVCVCMHEDVCMVMYEQVHHVVQV